MYLISIGNPIPNIIPASICAVLHVLKASPIRIIAKIIQIQKITFTIAFSPFPIFIGHSITRHTVGLNTDSSSKEIRASGCIRIVI